VQTVADRPHHRLFLGGLEDVVVLDVVAGGLRLPIALGVNRLIALVEQVEFELGGEIRLHAHGLQPRQLLLQQAARGVRYVLVTVMVEHVGDDQRRPGQPGDTPERRHVRLQDEVAIALRPVGGRVAGHWLHVDVVCQQIVAGMSLVMRGCDEMLGMEALADQLPGHVDHGDDHGVDLPGCHRSLQGLEGKRSRHRHP
jgi:hypothetical protein